MTDFCAFNDWLWRCDPKIAVRVQEYHEAWRKLLARQNAKCVPESGFTIVDDRYRIVFSEGDATFSLFSLKEEWPGLIAVYQTPSALFTGLIAHSIRRAEMHSPVEFSAEMTRMTDLCCRVWAQWTGE